MGLIESAKKLFLPPKAKASGVNDYTDGFRPIGARGATRAWEIVLPGTNRDWTEEAGELYLNGVISACLRWLMENVQEPRLTVGTGENDTIVYNENHPVVELLSNPNPSYGLSELLMSLAMDDTLDGNAFIYVVREKRTRIPREFYYLPHDMVDPFSKENTPDVSGYHMRGPGGKDVIVKSSDIMHFRFGTDPIKKLRGYPKLRGVLREICLDNEAATYSVNLVKNMAIPGLFITPKDSSTTIRDEQIELLKKLVKDKTTGDNRGEPIGSSIPLSITQLGFSPQDMALASMHDRPEARICAAIGIPAMVIGLMVGNEQRTYDNYGEAKKAAYKDCLLPMCYRWAQTLTRFFKREGMLEDDERIVFRTSHIAALQEDESERHRRVRETYMAGLLTRNEARNMLGFEDTTNGGDEFAEEASRPFPTKTEPEGGPKKDLFHSHISTILKQSFE